MSDNKTVYRGKDYPVHSPGPWSVTAAACQACHDFVDRRGNEWRNHSAEEIQWYHDRGIKRTIRLALDAGIIK